jgi:hypothetical protein
MMKNHEIPAPRYHAYSQPRKKWTSILLAVLGLGAVLQIVSVTNPLVLDFTSTGNKLSSVIQSHIKTSDPAEQWKDDIWPIRPLSPWDISTDYSYPRTLEYDVDEGTWIRLDVHPKTGELVFDMLGDLYCLPGIVTSASFSP